MSETDLDVLKRQKIDLESVDLFIFTEIYSFIKFS